MSQLSSAYRQVVKNKKWLGGVIAIILLVLPFLMGTYLTTMMVFILINSLVAMGLGLLIGWAGQFSLGQGAFFGIGAYASGFLSAKLGVNPWLAMVCATVFTGALSYFLGKPFLSVPGYKVGFVTIAFSLAFFVFVSRIDILGGHEGFSGIPQFAIAGFTLNKDFHYYYFGLVLVTVAFLLNRNLVGSKLGKQAKAMDIFTGGSVLATKSLGVDTGKLKTQIFMIAGVYAGLAGSLYAHYITHLNPEPFSVWTSILMLLIVLMGGVNSLWGGIVGAATYYILKEGLTAALGTQAPMGWQYLIFGVLVTLIILFFSKGIMGFFTNLHRRLQGDSNSTLVKKKGFNGRAS